MSEAMEPYPEYNAPKTGHEKGLAEGNPEGGLTETPRQETAGGRVASFFGWQQ
jgi:hypothetical protein